jgi:hypothetical protein
VKKVFCYSGGAQATDYSLAAKTLEQAGFEVLSEGKTSLQHKIWNNAHPIGWRGWTSTKK